MSYWIFSTIIALSVIDLVLTYFYLKAYRTRFPKGDWTLSEANPIIRFCIRRFGLGEGMIGSGLIVLFLVGTIAALISQNGRFFFAGFLTMANLTHFINYLALRRLMLK